MPFVIARNEAISLNTEIPRFARNDSRSSFGRGNGGAGFTRATISPNNLGALSFRMEQSGMRNLYSNWDCFVPRNDGPPQTPNGALNNDQSGSYQKQYFFSNVL
ncbi:MAG TPA: hypothetical protein VK808_08160 [Bacteroidia bacterium]|nr:hypothetical protein [Bacteroidia bacterium]